MTYFAAALARTSDGWTGEELSLDEVEDLDGLADLMRAVSDEADVTLLFVEEDDEWFAVVRADADGDARVFVSDLRVVDSSAIGALFADVASEPAAVGEDDDEAEDTEDDDADDRGPSLEAQPAGDADLLTDFGTPATRLRTLATTEGMLPADAISALCEKAGALDALEELRAV